MSHRKLLSLLSLFHAIVNTVYLVRFIGILSPEAVVYGYVPWFMSFALPNFAFTLLAWFLVYALFKKSDAIAALIGLISAGGLIFHALNGFMFAFYSGSLGAMTTFNAIFEIVVYLYGLALAGFYISQFWHVITRNIK